MSEERENYETKASTSQEIWDRLKQPPSDALKPILGGRLKGKTDINPQWRYEAITAIFGLCGIGWKYTIDKIWTEKGSQDQVLCFALISFFHRVKEGHNGWSDAIPGIGGSTLIEKETSGLHSNDEAYKMAVTDALSVALKMIGVGSNIYRGMSDSKYNKPQPSPSARPSGEIPNFVPPPEKESPKTTISDAQRKRLYAIAKSTGWADAEIKIYLKKAVGSEHTADVPSEKYEEICSHFATAREPGQEG